MPALGSRAAILPNPASRNRSAVSSTIDDSLLYFSHLYLKGHSDFSGGHNPSKKDVLKAVKKTFGFTETNLRHPSLNTHEFTSLKGPNVPFLIQNKNLGSDLNIEIRRIMRPRRIERIDRFQIKSHRLDFGDSKPLRLFLGGQELSGFGIDISSLHFRQDLTGLGIHHPADGSRVKLSGPGVDNPPFRNGSCGRFDGGGRESYGRRRGFGRRPLGIDHERRRRPSQDSFLRKCPGGP